MEEIIHVLGIAISRGGGAQTDKTQRITIQVNLYLFLYLFFPLFQAQPILNFDCDDHLLVDREMMWCVMCVFSEGAL